MSNSVRPHGLQPTRLLRPWDSPGKNTGVGCHFLLQCMKVKSESEVAQSCLTLVTPWTAAHQAPPSTGFSRQKYWSGVPLPSPLLSLGPLLSIGDLSGKFGHQDRSWKLTSEEKAYNPSALKFRHFSHCADGSQIISSSAPVPSCALHTGTGTQ